MADGTKKELREMQLRPCANWPTAVTFNSGTSLWECTYSDVTGTGATPELACAAFDSIWLTGS